MITLSKDDVSAIKHCTSFSVRFRPDGKHTLSLVKEVRQPKSRNGFTPTRDQSELRRDLEDLDGYRGTAGWFHVMFANSNGNWQALGHIVRAGDSLRFYADNGSENDYIRNAEIPTGKLGPAYTHQHYDRLYCDELNVDIIRNDKPIIRGLSLTFSICPQNSARAIQSQESRYTYSLA